MDTFHLIDPELRSLLDVLPATTLSTEILAELRSREFPMPSVPNNGTTLDRRTVPGPTGAPNVELRIYRPPRNEKLLPCIYHIHGGGYMWGAAADLEFFHRQLVAELDCALVSVDYRLAPETRFPGAIEDCYAGLAWLHAHVTELQVDPTRIGVMGESAGGGLAASLALLARDRGEYQIAFQHLVYPALDDRTCTVTDPHPYNGQFVWTTERNAFGWEALLGREPGGDDVSPYAAAARAEDLSGLPPAFISVGALDLFLEEDIEYARRLIRAGVPTEVHVYPRAIHGFDFQIGAAVAAQATSDRIAALRRALR